MGLIEIILTIVSWNRGWRWYSLIPLATVIVLSFLLGFTGSEVNAQYLDILGIVALIIMSCIKKPIKDLIVSESDSIDNEE